MPNPIQLDSKHFYLSIALALLSLGLQSRSVNAQLSSNTSTFSAEVSASCSFINFPEAIELSWTGSRLQTDQNAVNGVFFDILANVPVKISHGGMTVTDEPTGIQADPGLFLRRRSDNERLFQVYRSSNPTSAELLNTANVPEPVRIFSWVNFHHLGGAPIGRYAYSITLSCLL